MKKVLLFFLLVTFKASAQINPANITIARDSFGVPHIFAPTDPEVAYGIAWAHAEDDFETLQLVALIAKKLSPVVVLTEFIAKAFEPWVLKPGIVAIFPPNICGNTLSTPQKRLVEKTTAVM